MASATVMAITERSISGSEKSVPAKDGQSKRLRRAASPHYGFFNMKINGLAANLHKMAQAPHSLRFKSAIGLEE
jgi:hypothetical protein